MIYPVWPRFWSFANGWIPGLSGLWFLVGELVEVRYFTVLLKEDGPEIFLLRERWRRSIVLRDVLFEMETGWSRMQPDEGGVGNLNTRNQVSRNNKVKKIVTRISVDGLSASIYLFLPRLTLPTQLQQQHTPPQPQSCVARWLNPMSLHRSRK